MAQKTGFNKVVTFVAWLTGVIVSLAVGSALIRGVIAVPYIGNMVNIIAGWVVVVVTILGAVLAIAGKFSA